MKTTLKKCLTLFAFTIAILIHIVPMKSFAGIKINSLVGYPIPNGNSNVYSDQTLKNKIGLLYDTDLVKILEVNENYVKVSYTVTKTGKSKQGYVPLETMLLSTTGHPIKLERNQTAYARPYGKKSGSAYVTDEIYKFGDAVNGYVQVMYSLDAGGYKLGFIPESAILSSNSENKSSTTEISDRQKAIINAATSMLGDSRYEGYCQKWVRVVGEKIGLPSGNASSALHACDMWKVSDSMEDIPFGATVYLRSKNKSSAGYKYGHVGLYADGYVYHAPNKVKKQKLTDLLKNYDYLGWGWQSGVDLR